MRKKYLLVLLSLFSLVSCSSFKNQILSFDTETYQKDLLKINDKTYSNIDEALFKVNSFVYYDDNSYVYTIQIEYKNESLNSFKAILIPENFDHKSTLPTVGYTETLCLNKTKNSNEGKYPGFNLSYKTNVDDMKFDLFISFNIESYQDDFYLIDTYEKLGD